MNKTAVALFAKNGTPDSRVDISGPNAASRTGIPAVRPGDAAPLKNSGFGTRSTTANSSTTSTSTSSSTSPPRMKALKEFYISDASDSSSSYSESQDSEDENTSSNSPPSRSNSPSRSPGAPAYAIRNNVQHVRKERKEAWRRALNSATPLIVAIKAKDWDKVRELAKSGADLNRPDARGFTPLHLAALLGYVLAAHALLENKADRHISTREGYTAIMLAASRRHLRMVELLADDKQASDKSTSTAAVSGPTAYGHAKLLVSGLDRADRVETFKAAIIGNDFVMAARLLAAGNVTISDRDGNGMPALVLGAIAGDSQMIRLLLCNGAKINQTDTQGKSPLMHAAECRHLDTIALLLRAGADAGQTDVHGNTALSLAVAYDDAKVLDALLGCRNGGGKLHKYMAALLRSAASAGSTDAAKKLLDRKADLPDASGNLTLAALAKTNQLVAFKTLLQAGADPHHQAWDGNTAFTLAATNGHTEIVKALFAHLPTGLNKTDWIQRLQQETDHGGRTAFMLAVLKKQHPMVDLLILNKADQDKTDLKGRNAMLWAAAKGDVPLVKVLLLYTSPLVLDNDGNSAFLTAARYGNKEVIKRLVDKGYAGGSTNMNTPNKEGDTPLIAAARNGHLDVVKFLLSENVNCLHQNRLGRTALLEAATYAHIEVMALLQHHERELPMVYPAMDAFIKNFIWAMPAVSCILPGLQQPASRQTDKAGNSVLHLIADRGHSPGLGQLLATRSEPMDRALRNTAQGGASKSVVLNEISSAPILHRPALLDMEMTNKEGMTPLCIAVRKGNYAMVKLMLEQGAQPNHVSTDGISPLWFACRLEECMADHGAPENKTDSRPLPVDMVALLLEHGAGVDHMSFRSQTPLMAASATGDPAVVLQLIRAGAKVDLMDIDEFTPLMYAANHGHTHIAAMLLDEGAEPDQHEGVFTALILAAQGGYDDMVKLLVKRGAQTNHVNITGSTALIVASANGKVSTTKLLISLGANLSVRNKAGRDAMHYAKAGNHLEIIDLLQKGHPESHDS